MLQQQFTEIKSEELKKDLIGAYTRRRLKELANSFSRLDDYKKQDDVRNYHEPPTKQVYTFIGIGEHDYEDVGKYTVFPNSDIQKYFLNNEMFGDYFSKEFYRTKKFAIMVTEEVSKICLIYPLFKKPQDKQKQDQYV